MFTGIITEIGVVRQIQSLGGGIRLRINAPQSTPCVNVNDSISINGACHTVISRDATSFAVESVEETLEKTSFRSLKVGDTVNLELPMPALGRFDGHIVLGHVDTVGSIAKIEQRENSWMFTVEIPDDFLRYVVLVGSVAIDGVSLTVAQLQGNRLTVSIIPHTMEHTIFKSYVIGSIVNIEFDIVGKYIERLMSQSGNAGSEKKLLTEQQLREQGF